MRLIKIITSFGEYTAGAVELVEDQAACDAIAQGLAVPSIEPVAKAVEAAPENKAIESAPEVK
jgi:hypothetical protein